jgi:hypothetical protein
MFGVYAAKTYQNPMQAQHTDSALGCVRSRNLKKKTNKEKEKIKK